MGEMSRDVEWEGGSRDLAVNGWTLQAAHELAAFKIGLDCHERRLAAHPMRK